MAASTNYCYMALPTLLLLTFLFNAVCADLDALHFDTFDQPSRTCEAITVDMCKDQLGYNFTGGPNFLNEEAFTQQDSSMLLKTFEPLISNGCSRQLKRFLCTAYVPMCDPQVEQLIGPCRSVCENVKVREYNCATYRYLVLFPYLR